jgi:hypothetical protein
MWILPLIVSILLIVGIWALQRSDGQRSKRATHRYYLKHRALLEDLDRMRRGLIGIFERVSSTPTGQSDGFAAYEKLVNDFERLLISINLLPIASPNLALLKSVEI